MRKMLTLVVASSICAIAPVAEANVFDNAIRAAARVIARHKGDRIFHSAGQAYHATVRTRSGTYPGIVRLSRGTNTMNILGLAVKVKGPVDQDFLLVTARSDHGILARVPTRRTNFADNTFSSLTSFERDSMTSVVTARTPHDMNFDHGGTAANASETPAFQLRMPVPGAGGREFQNLGWVEVHADQPLSAKESAGLRFTPANDGAHIYPVGIINRIRRSVYEGSVEGRTQAQNRS